MDMGLVLTIIFGLFAIVAIPLMIIFYLRGRRQKEPVWSYLTKKVIGLGADSPKELFLTFEGRTVQEVFETKVVFWNKGRETIKSEDIADELGIVFSGGVTVLGKPEVEASRDVVGFSTMKTGGVVLFGFKFLDHDDGALIRILHTGAHDLLIKIEIAGTIMGCPKGIAYAGKFALPQSWSYYLRESIPAALALIALFGLSVRELIAGENYGIGWWVLPSLLAAMFVYFVAASTVSFYRSRKLPKWSWPRKQTGEK